MSARCSTGRFARMLHGVVVASMVLAVSIGVTSAAASAATGAGRQVTPERYVRGACAAVITWVEKTWLIDEQITATADGLSVGKLSAKAAKAKTVALYTKAASTTDAAVKATKALGAPKIDGGAAIAEEHLAGLSDIAGIYRGAAKHAGALSTKDEASLYDELTNLDLETLDAFDAVGMPLEALQSDPALAPILDVTEDCAAVVEAYTLSVAPTGWVAGDCVDFKAWETVDCTAPHDAEVYLVTAYPAPDGAAFPGDTAIHDWVDTACEAAYGAYVGIDLQSSMYDYTTVHPNAETWSAGDREVVCAVASMDDRQLTGAVRGTGR